MRVARFGSVLFGIGVAGIALLSLIYGNFVPLIEPLSYRPCTYGFGAILLLAGVGICFVRSAAGSAVVIGVIAAVWTVSCILLTLRTPLNVGAWYPPSEAVSTLVGAWLVYAWLKKGHPPAVAGERAQLVARILFGAACLVYGLAHFAYATYSEPFVPRWLPAPMALVYFTGACHAAAGVGLIFGILPRLAATLEAIMMSLFQVLVWFPSFFTHPTPKWAGSPQNQALETSMNFLLAGTAWLVAASLCSRPWGFTRRKA